MKFELVIKADTNDADYITATNVVTQETLDNLAPIVEAIKRRNATTRRGSGNHNWPSSEYRDETPNEVYEGILTEEQIEFFDELRPYGENGIHTIESIEYYPLPEKVKLL